MIRIVVVPAVVPAVVAASVSAAAASGKNIVRRVAYLLLTIPLPFYNNIIYRGSMHLYAPCV